MLTRSEPEYLDYWMIDEKVMLRLVIVEATVELPDIQCTEGRAAGIQS